MTLQQAEADSPGYRLSTAVSYLINPLVLPPIQFGLVLWHFTAGAREIGFAVAISLVFFCLIPLAYLAAMVRRGGAATLEVRRRRARTAPFLFGIASYLVGFAVLSLMLQTARPVVLALVAIYPINTALIALINLRWKISVHVTSIAGFVAGLLFVAWIPWNAPTLGVLNGISVAPWFMLIPLLMWARVRAGAHTPGQVVAGAIFGFGMTLAQLFAALSALGGA